MSKSVSLLAGIACLFVMVGCNAPTDSASTNNNREVYSGSYPINVVATVGMVGDIVRHVGGRHVNVDQICGTGVDPHLYSPTNDDMKTIRRSDMVFYCGLMLEGKMTDALISVARSKPVFAVTEIIDRELLLEPAEFQGHFDPHVWMDVSLWAECVGLVVQQLVEFDPDHAADYRQNAESYRLQLGKLHQYGLDTIATIPAASRVLITSHDAFNYFGRAYGLDVQGIQGVSTESEAGLQRINELVDTLVKKNVRAVFVESSVSRKNIDALREGAAAKGHKVTVGGELFSDAMGRSSSYEGTYIGMLDHNITVATRALGGTADASGMNGKLATEDGVE